MLGRRILPFVLVAASLMVGWPASAASADPVWSKVYDRPGTGLGSVAATVVDPNAPYYVFAVGTSVGLDTNADIVTIAYDAYTGKKIWARRYDGPAHGADQGIAIGIAFDMVVVTGSSETTAGSGSSDVITIAYHEPDGVQRWADRFSMSSHSSDSPVDLVTASGSTFVLVAGTDHGGLVRYDSTGIRMWHRSVTNRNLASLVGVEEIGGYLFVVGNTFKTTGGTSYFTAGLRELDGSDVWTKHFDGPGGGSALATGASAGGTTLYVTGTATDASTERITTIGYEPHDGTRMFFRSIAPQAPGNADVGPRVAITPDGSKIAVAATSYLNGVGTYLTRSYGADGSVLWTARENGLDDAGTVADVAIEAGGRVYVTGGGTMSAGTPGLLTVGYASTGAPATWVAAVAPTTNTDTATCLTFDLYLFRVYVGSRWNDDLRVDAYSA